MTTTSAMFSNLSITDAEVPRTRTALADNPFYVALKDSAAKRNPAEGPKWEGQGKQASFPAANAARAEQLIRQAAEALNVGSAVRLRTPAGKPVEIESVGAKTVASKKPGGKPRKSGGTPTPMVDGKKYDGAVNCFFFAKSPRDTKKSTTAATTASPMPADSAPAAAAPAAPSK